MKHTQKGSDGEGILFASLGLLTEKLYALVRRREVVMMTGERLRYDENGVLGQFQNIKGKAY